MTKVFLDTNVLVYANDRRDLQKQARAAELIADCIAAQTGVVSTQVLQEFAVVALSKLGQASDFVLRRLGQFESLEVVQVTPYLVRRGVELHDRYRTHFWDALVLAAAEHAGCHRVWSEDLSAKTDYGSVRVENPFSDV